MALGAAFVMGLILTVTIVFYGAVMVSRMLLPILAATAVLLCMINPPVGTLHQLMLVLAAGMVFLQGAGNLYLPQKLGNFDQETTAVLEREMPRSDENLWENTVAVSVFKQWPFDVCFAIPPWCGMSYCNHEYLYDALRNQTLKSRYVLTDISNTELTELCESRGEMIWTDGASGIYRIDK